MCRIPSLLKYLFTTSNLYEYLDLDDMRRRGQPQRRRKDKFVPLTFHNDGYNNNHHNQGRGGGGGDRGNYHHNRYRGGQQQDSYNR